VSRNDWLLVAIIVTLTMMGTMLCVVYTQLPGGPH
jgi:hypothetical protein